jgi:hypothetical protein
MSLMNHFREWMSKFKGRMNHSPRFAYIYTHIHIYIYIYIYIHMHTYIHTRPYIYTYIHAYLRLVTNRIQTTGRAHTTLWHIHVENRLCDGYRWKWRLLYRLGQCVAFSAADYKLTALSSKCLSIPDFPAEVIIQVTSSTGDDFRRSDHQPFTAQWFYSKFQFSRPKLYMKEQNVYKSPRAERVFS